MTEVATTPEQRVTRATLGTIADAADRDGLESPVVTVIGAVTAAGLGAGSLAEILGFLAVVAATVNVVGGFLVTDRMLRMFRRPRQPKPDKT